MDRSRGTRNRRRGLRRPARRTLRESPDEQLVELVLDGEDAAFDVLFDRHVSDALWFARETLGSGEEAEEAVRHSFAAAHAYLATRGPEIEFAPWLQTILGNYCLSMLQARVQRPRRRRGMAAVVDLDAWRRRRGLGVAFPVAPLTGLRDSVMAACGLGGGAASAGAPAVGGVVAKLAAVAVLAGSVGVAGEVASDRAAPAEGDAQAKVERRAEPSAGRSAGGGVRVLAGGRPGDSEATPGGPASAPRATRDRRTWRAGFPVKRSPSATETESGGGPGGGSVTAGAPETSASQRPPISEAAVPESVADATSPLRSTLRRVGTTVKHRVPPAAVGIVRSIPRGVAGQPAIGDDPGVTPAKSPIDVRALLHGANARPK